MNWRLRSWLAKMDLVKRMLVDEASPLPKLDVLACAYIYLQVCFATRPEAEPCTSHLNKVHPIL